MTERNGGAVKRQTGNPWAGVAAWGLFLTALVVVVWILWGQCG